MAERAVVAVASLLVFSSALHFLGGQVADPDLWQHLRFGDMLREGAFPRVDVFSYTAYGEPIVNHEWLAQWLFAAAYAAGGSAGLVILKLVVGAVLIAAALDTAGRIATGLAGERIHLHPIPVAAVLVLCLAVVSPGATFRPQLFTIALLAVQSALLARADLRLHAPRGGRGGVGWELWVQPLLLAVWANLHGGYVVGVGMLGVFAVGRVACELGWAGSSGGSLTPRQLAWLGAVAVAGCAAPLANPYGIGLYSFLLRTLHLHGEISEWYPVTVFSTEFLRFKLLALATAAGTAFLAREYRDRPEAVSMLVWRGAFLLLTALYSLRHQRHTVLFAVVAAPLVIVAVDRLWRVLPLRFPSLRRRAPMGATVWLGALAIAAFQLHGYGAMLARQGLDIHYGRLDFPADAVEFLRARGIAGNVAMPFEWGSYAIWKLPPSSRVFIDGRFETVYPQQVIDDYFAFMNGTEGWERLLDAYPTEVVVVQRWRNIHQRLFRRPDLTYVYSDPASLVFVRRTATNEDALERLASLRDRAAFAPDTVFP